MMPEDVVKCISPKTKAIVAVHIFGICAPVSEYRKFGLPVIEDCCQLFAHTVNGVSIGVDADFAFYSFHATKCLTTGEGGAVTCINSSYAERFAQVCEEYASLFPLSDIACALGLSQLNDYDAMQARRISIANYYFNNLPEAYTSSLKSVGASLYFRFPLRIKEGDFEAIKEKAHHEGVAIRKGVDELLHLKYNTGHTCPNAEALFKETVSVPIYPALTDAEAAKVCSVINTLTDEN